MARYPAVPRVYDYLKDNPEAERIYREISQWGGALVNQLDTRDLKVDAAPSTNIYTVVTEYILVEGLASACKSLVSN